MKKYIFILVLAVVALASCEKSEDDTTYDPTKDGIVGEWYSSKTDIAPLLAGLGIDSIYANFKADYTYVVESFTKGAKTTLTGTYSQVKPTTGTIWEITVNQGSPTTLTSKGIFGVTGTGATATMQYEVAQTEPVITGVTAPTVAGGFGSTSGGAFGVLNVQKYKRIEK